MKENTCVLVIDIGKTHVKLHVLDPTFTSLFSKQMRNEVETQADYPSINITAIWQWLVKGIKEVTKIYSIRAISITAHGATTALINRNTVGSAGLVLPIMDYEYQGITSATPEYTNIRPKFSDTYSADLPGGLNIGRQLYWLKREFPEQFSSMTDILMYPQYWTWRFTGQPYAEITSLGCHTDLWSLQKNDYSSLVDTLKCRELLPEIRPAWFDCGEIFSGLRAELGLHADCKVFNGIHDSNASFLRYRLTQGDAPFTVISTGTWTIIMSTQVPLDKLDEHKQMLANIDVTGRAIACARFMGGREFEIICEQSGSRLEEQFSENDIQNIIDQQVFALPNFSQGSGPFGSRKSGFIGDVNPISGIALATLYCALMIDYQLSLLGAKGNIFIEGAFLKNPLLCALINQLKEEQAVFMSNDDTGTVQGAGYLTMWGNVECSINVENAKKTHLTSLLSYKRQWLKYTLDA
jgi:sugar (pentulose or hexulose) kinase